MCQFLIWTTRYIFHDYRVVFMSLNIKWTNMYVQLQHAIISLGLHSIWGGCRHLSLQALIWLIYQDLIFHILWSTLKCIEECLSVCLSNSFTQSHFDYLIGTSLFSDLSRSTPASFIEGDLVPLSFLRLSFHYDWGVYFFVIQSK